MNDKDLLQNSKNSPPFYISFQIPEDVREKVRTTEQTRLVTLLSFVQRTYAEALRIKKNWNKDNWIFNLNSSKNMYFCWTDMMQF